MRARLSALTGMTVALVLVLALVPGPAAGTPPGALGAPDAPAADPAAASGSVTVEPQLWHQLEPAGATTTFWVYLRDEVQVAEAAGISDRGHLDILPQTCVWFLGVRSAGNFNFGDTHSRPSQV